MAFVPCMYCAFCFVRPCDFCKRSFVVACPNHTGFSLSFFFYRRYQGIVADIPALIGWMALFLFSLNVLRRACFAGLPARIRNFGARMSIKTQRVVLAALFAFCAIPFVVALWPGAVWFDSGKQPYQYLGYAPLELNALYFQTLLIGVPVKIAHALGCDSLGIFAYTFLQMIFYAVVLAYAIRILERTRQCFLVKLGLVVMYAINPIYIIYSISVGKDTNFALVIYLIVLLLMDIYVVSGKAETNRKKKIALFLSLILLLLLRNWAGVGLALGFAAVIGILSKKIGKTVALAATQSLSGALCVPSRRLHERKGY